MGLKMSDVKLSIVDGKKDIPFVSDCKNLDVAGFYPWALAFMRNAMDVYEKEFDESDIRSDIAEFIFKHKSEFNVSREKLAPGLETLFKYKTFDMEAYTIVLINGKYIPEISDEEDLPFSIYSDGIHNCLIDNPEFLQNRLFIGEDLFVRLNSAYLCDGIVLKVAKGESLSKPLHIISLCLSDDGVVFTNPRVVIELEEGAKLDLLESSLSLDGVKYFENKVLQIDLKAGAELNHYRYTNCSLESVTVERDFVECGDMATYNMFNSVVKSGMTDVRYSFNILSGANVNAYTSIYSAGDKKREFVADISHIGSDANSDVQFFGVADEESKVSFETGLSTSSLLEGVKTSQISKILLMSDKSAGEIKPFQSIYSQNVSAFHGAVISGIRDEDLFFLKSRGIDDKSARDIIYKSFLSGCFGGIKNSLVLDEFVKFYWDD